MKRKELASIIAKTIHQHRLDNFTLRALALAILDEVEEPIRADERERWKSMMTALTQQLLNQRMDLRTRVAALQTVPSTYDGIPILPDPATIQGVLDLIDGGS